ncbi:hypothetical protein DFH07DRAFT_22025 [Mycena maculata]|uniref:Uncharacterized protein n=1 Tax=Mycena maculata TaxID=230809 RepID=A0AAD7N3U5_9AGAR|nr:hypothetical protein DFH07DRAFT_22025 [Mycena maculata]
MAAPFSRLQLAAALLEYDNDPTNPEAPHRSAQESAIFANFRRAQSRAQLAVRKSDYLGVALPSETGSLGGRESALSGRRSRGSLNILRNPFGADESGEYEDEEGDDEEDELEVDLSSWGLDAFIPKDKEPKASKRRSRTATLPNPHPVLSVRPQQSYAGDAPRRTTRSMSVGNLDDLATNLEENRRKSFGSPLDLDQVDHTAFQRTRVTSHSFVQPPPETSPPPHNYVPFPTGSVRSTSPQPRQEDMRSSVFTSRFDPKSHERQPSSASLGPRSVLRGDDDENMEPRMRRMSNGTMNSRFALADDNPFALQPPSTMSRFDPKAAAHARTMSNASMGSRMMLDDASVITGQGRERRYSTLELLRPKVLVMPSPLQPASGLIAPSSSQTRDGFLSSSDPPLPPGARSTRRSSVAYTTLEPSSAPAASNLFTPNPRMNLTLSQLTFRNTLLVGGQRDVTYSDIDADLPRAVEDGVQVQQTLPITEPETVPQIVTPSEDQSKPNRPAGKLFGKSLIDDLEGRKAMMRTKQRVFTGDARPSMMARQSQRKSTLIDPESLQARPDSQGRPLTQHMGSFDSQGSQQLLGRRNSVNAKPLLNFDNDDKLLRPGMGRPAPSSRSVFGVDTLWERELVKLKEIEAKEKVEEDLRKAKEAEEEVRGERKRGRKTKRKDNSKPRDDISPAADAPDAMSIAEPAPTDIRIASSPPVLPAISPVRRRPPPVNDDSDSEESERAGPSRPRESAPDGWVSSDEEGNGPTRTPGIGPRFTKKPQRLDIGGDDSEEDLPLAATLDRVARRATQLQISAPDSDEEQPLSVLLQKTKMSLPSINFDRRSQSNGAHDDDEDDQPLGLRASRVAPSFSSVQGDGEDDDTPLAFHPEQQRRSQYHMMAQAAQQQQHQQQMMMQAQMHSSMFFSPQPMMASGYFGPPMMMQPSAAPMHDETKYGQVDRWRRDVAVEEA